MFLSSENSQKGVKNKAALKANNFISPATQGENTIQFHGNILSHRRRHLLIFYFWKRKIAKIESRQNGALLSFPEKALWLVYQFSKEFKNCFLLSPATSVIEALTHFKKVILHFMLLFHFVRLPNHLSQMHSGASSGEMTHRPFLVKEKQSPDSVLIARAVSNDEIQRSPCTVPRLRDGPDFTLFLRK